MSLEDLDKKFEDLTAKMEKRFDEFREKIEERFTSQKPASEAQDESQGELRKHRDTPFWGVVLVIVGVILLGNHFDWFDLGIPIIPAALIILGCYLILENRQNR